MKRLMAAVVLTVSGAANAQIPVTDIAQIVENGIQHGMTIAKWVENYEQLMRQYDQLIKTHQALTDARGLGDAVDDYRLRRYLPEDWQQVYWAYKTKGYEGLIRKGVQIYEETKIHDACENIELDDQRTTCEAQAVKGAQDYAFASESMDLSELRTDQIDGLRETINMTMDPKAIAELQARIQIEQASIANEQTKLELQDRMTDASDRLLDQRQREMHARSLTATKGVIIEPLTFD